MKDDIKYKEAIDKIKRTPILDNPEILVNSVIARIETLDPRRNNKIYLLAGWVSTAAAILLLFLFVNQQRLGEKTNFTQLDFEQTSVKHSDSLDVYSVIKHKQALRAKKNSAYSTFVNR